MSTRTDAAAGGRTNRTGLLVLAWLWVGLPFAWGVYELVLKVVKLFGS